MLKLGLKVFVVSQILFFGGYDYNALYQFKESLPSQDERSNSVSAVFNGLTIELAESCADRAVNEGYATSHRLREYFIQIEQQDRIVYILMSHQSPISVADEQVLTGNGMSSRFSCEFYFVDPFTISEDWMLRVHN